MSSFTRTRRPVKTSNLKPITRPAGHRFGQGILDPLNELLAEREAETRYWLRVGMIVQAETLASLERPRPYTAADLVWATSAFADEPMPAPICGGSPEVGGAENWPAWTDEFRWELGTAVEVDVADMLDRLQDELDQDADRLANIAQALDRMERGLDGSDHGDARQFAHNGHPADLD